MLDKCLAADSGWGGFQLFFHQAFGGKAVIVIPHRVEDAPAVHTPEASHKVGVAVGIDVAQVKFARDSGRGCVNGVHGAFRLPVKCVDI